MTTPTKQQALAAVRTLIEYIGDDPDRPGLRETPERVLSAWTNEWGEGYRNHDLQSIVKEFPEEEYPVDELIVVKDISFHSSCEHHMCPFYGVVHIGYIPIGKKILGLSKLARLVDFYARRLQVQERLTNQIAEGMQSLISPLGLGVVIEAAHLCMLSRGVKQASSFAITSALRGALKDLGPARAEFLSLCRDGDGFGGKRS